MTRLLTSVIVLYALTACCSPDVKPLPAKPIVILPEPLVIPNDTNYTVEEIEVEVINE